MWGIALGFLKDKLFGGNNVFFTLLAIFIGVFIFYNSEVILSKFGFTTKTNLSRALGKSETNVTILGGKNKELSDTITMIEKDSSNKVNVIGELSNKNDSTKDKVTEIKTTHAEKTKVELEALAKTMVAKEGNIILPEKEYNNLSKANIETLVDAYYRLCPTETKENIDARDKH